jgi:hypothetical protein
MEDILVAWNAPGPIVLTDSGKMISPLRFEQPTKFHNPIVIREFPNSTLEILMQLSKTNLGSEEGGSEPETK